MQKRCVCCLNQRQLSRSLPFLPLAAVTVGALSSGCGSGNGTAPINPPIVQTPVVLPSVPVVFPTPVPSGTPTPTASASPTPSPSPSATPIVAPTFAVTDLGQYNNQSVSVFKINDAGQVLVKPNTGSSTNPILLYTNGAYQTVTNSVTNGIPRDVNAAGIIVGYYSPDSSGTNYRPFIVDGDGFRELDIFRGSFTLAQAINNKGQIVGESFRNNATTLGSPAEGFLYDNGTVTDLGYLSGAAPSATSSTYTYDINDNGQIVGTSTLASGNSHAFLWQNGAMRDLGALTSDGNSSAYAINNKGQAVGYSASASDTYASAVLFDNGAVQKLNVIVNGVTADGASASDINDSGQIVGTYYKSAISHAFYYDHGLVVDLNTYLNSRFTNVIGQSINNKGQVLVTNVIPGFNNDFIGNTGSPYILTPITKAAHVVGFTVSAAKPASIARFGKTH